MPLNCTPPTEPAGTAMPLLQHSSSEPALTSEFIPEFGTPSGSTPIQPQFRSSKRRRGVRDDDGATFDTFDTFMCDMKQMMADFQSQQNSKYDKLFAVVEDFRVAVDFLVHKNESLQTQVNKLETERTANMKYIVSLEDKLDSFERSARSTCLEIRNLPSFQPETKTSLVASVTKIAGVLNVPMQTLEVKDIFRINSKDPARRTVIVDFTSVLLKEKFITKYKQCNKENNQLTTEKLRIAGPPRPIFISENLSTKMKKLFFMAREHAKENDFKFCWTSNGRVFLRKREGGPLVRITTEADLTALSNNN